MNIRQKYIEEVLKEESVRLKKSQDIAIEELTEAKSGALLNHRFYSVHNSGEGGMLSFQHPIYERFLDMRRTGNGKRQKRRKIHNKYIYKTISTISARLMYGFTEEVVEDIRARFKDLEG